MEELKTFKFDDLPGGSKERAIAFHIMDEDVEIDAITAKKVREQIRELLASKDFTYNIHGRKVEK